jgi:hypothetical protein
MPNQNILDILQRLGLCCTPWLIAVFVTRLAVSFAATAELSWQRATLLAIIQQCMFIMHESDRVAGL